jgi:hypothetical protein
LVLVEVHQAVAVEHKITVVQMVHMAVAVEVQELLAKVMMAELVLVLGTQVLVEVLEDQDALTHLVVVQECQTTF